MVRVRCTFRRCPPPRDSSRAIIRLRESLDAEFRHLVCGDWPGRAARTPVAALALSSRASPHLLLGVFLPGVSDPRTPWAKRFAAGECVPRAAGAACGGVALLVRAHTFVAWQW